MAAPGSATRSAPLGALLILWLLWFGVRKRRYASSAGTVQGWLSAHVYLGTALLVVATLHTGFELGWNLHTLAYLLMVATVASGFYGAYIYLSVPGLMTANRGEETLDAMLLKVADLDREIREKALSLPDQILKVVNASLDNTRLGGSFLRILTGRDRACPTAAAVRDLPEHRQAAHRATPRSSTTRSTRCCCRRTRSSRAPAATCASRRGSTCGSTSTSRSRSRCSPRSRRTWSPCSSTGSRAPGADVKLLVISQSRNRAGRTVQVRKDVSADWVRVGRNAASEVLLADPRIALNQGLIVDRNGPVYTEGEMGTSTSTTRKAVRSVRLSPGTSIDVGPYRITAVPAPAGYTGAITVELVRPRRATIAPEFVARATKLTLASLGLPKRAAALALFALVAVVFFLLPAGRVLDLPWRQPASRRDGERPVLEPGAGDARAPADRREVRGLPRAALPAGARRRLPRMPRAGSATTSPRR